MPTALAAPSREEWYQYEHSPMAKQQEFINKCIREDCQPGEEIYFKKEEITNLDSIQAGDHLVAERRCYDHHMLCIKSNGDLKTVIHYTTASASSDKSSRSSKSISFKDLTVKAKIKEEDLQFKDLLDEKVKKIIWPDKLKRFSVEEVIARAKNRKGETWYDLLKNNCEHFVTWCICGLNVSLQVKRWCVTAREVGYSVFTGLYDCGRNKALTFLIKALANVSNEIAKNKQLPAWVIKLLANVSDEIAKNKHLPAWLIKRLANVFDEIVKNKHLPAWLIKLLANVSDEIAVFISKNALYVGYGLAIALEAGLAGYELYKAFKFCKTTEEFKSKLVNIVAKATCRLGFGIVGSCMGAAFCPTAAPIASLIGGAVGAGIGHFIGYLIGECYEYRDYMFE